jgi:D-3-phosphoglycerate dehydrogenase
MRIVVPDDFPAVFTGSTAEARLRSLGDVSIFTERGADDAVELARRIGNADVVVNIRAHAHFTDGVLEACPSLRLISIWGTGTDNVDLDACRARGITVTNTPGVNAHAVAEHTMALMLAVARHIPALDRGVRDGTWPRGQIEQLEGKTIGIVGLGAIGRRVATLARAFGMRVLAWTATSDGGRAASVGAELTPLNDLLGASDFVTLHLRLSPATENLLGAQRLALMKPSAYVINTARGGLVDRAALVDALAGKRIAGAALDVFHDEPLPAGDPLGALPNVVLTPHNAGMTREVIAAGLQMAVANVEAFVAPEPP